MSKVRVWESTIDESKKLAQAEPLDMLEGEGPETTDYTVTVDESVAYQQMDGFGASFTDASAWLVHHALSPELREELMRKLFDREEGIGVSFLRQPMGASDFAWRIYSYDDVEPGETDYELARFSIDHDRQYIIPLLHRAKVLNPDLKVMASPWSPPGWMKTSGSMIGGTLKPECYGVYADYFVQFLDAYEAEGIPIYAVTMQNEPGYEPKEYPGMIVTPEEEARFIREHLGPRLAGRKRPVKIMCYDHNWDVPEHPRAIYEDSEASRYVAGTAWHVYGGRHEAMSDIKERFPDKDVWFTEASGGEWVPPFRDAFLDQMKHVIRTTRNWSKSVVWWNMALDEENGPTVLSRSTCRGVVKIDKRTGELTYNLDYFTLGHISKFVMPGAYRIDSDTYEDDLETAAFRNGDGSNVLIVSNRTKDRKTLTAKSGNRSFFYEIEGEAAVTFRWDADG
ncbi:glycoside hydrolase family 30 beta sandwich domain-containing protein [Paenibacillus thermoaerophilus]|uniref:Glycoside hydrolase family 30 beta sandwich domain-containing protein n=1 Tax=Paenibacillus thermoaerophilus TaxID=1215385 RepID=A0ABW2V034_9BACL|nr:glycoside hydrolase family 30 beta sandwich domain-containing protein [Paenibacillus thermoaerophilus]TMV18235.1 glycosyl hydrolase [Paenibacillus thermoaerophilus]